MEESIKKLKPLSASRIKTLESCSWIYWNTYHNKLPQGSNDGARAGSVCHSIFELLLAKKHNLKFKKIIEAGTVSVIKSISRLITIYAKKEGLTLTPEVLGKIDRMILVGLRTDFFVKGGKLIAPEFRFEIQNEEPKYLIKGFMDKPFAKKDSIIIDDFKSSKRKYEGEDQESNIQGMIYSLAARKLWPDKKPIIRFIFLQFPEDPIMKMEFDNDTLRGFEYYLESIQERIEKFNEKDAVSNFAQSKGFPKDGSFGGSLQCGFATRPGQLKKDGTLMYHCPLKFAFEYYVVKKDGEIKSATMDKNIKLKDGEVLERVSYPGCPVFMDPFKRKVLMASMNNPSGKVVK